MKTLAVRTFDKSADLMTTSLICVTAAVAALMLMSLVSAPTLAPQGSYDAITIYNAM